MDERNEIAENLKRFLETAEMRNVMKKEKKIDESLSEKAENGGLKAEEPTVENVDNDEEHLYTRAYNKDEKRIDNSFFDAYKHSEKRNQKQFEYNPLEKYFRRPGVSIKLPSQGHYNPDMALLPSGEINVFPLTAKDEIWLRNPDALLNGTAIIEIIKSCCPDLRQVNIMNMVINDINAILMGIQRASYGQIIEAKSRCSSCSKENNVKVDMDLVLSQIEFLEDAYAYAMTENVLIKGSENIKNMKPDLVLFLEPTRYHVVIPHTLVTFEETKIVQILQNAEMNEAEKEREIYERLKRIHEINLKFMTSSVARIVTPEGEVIEDENAIADFILNMPIGSYKALEKHIAYINSIGVPTKWFYKCIHCEKENEIDISYDPQNFL